MYHSGSCAWLRVLGNVCVISISWYKVNGKLNKETLTRRNKACEFMISQSPVYHPSSLSQFGLLLLSYCSRTHLTSYRCRYLKFRCINFHLWGRIYRSVLRLHRSFVMIGKICGEGEMMKGLLKIYHCGVNKSGF